MCCPCKNIDYCSFYLSNLTQIIVVLLCVSVCWHGSPHLTGMSLSVCDRPFSVTAVHGKLCKGLGQGEVTWSAVWKRLAGQREGGQALWRAGDGVYEVCTDTVKLQTSLSLCRGAGGHTEPVWLCVCVNICVYGCWEGGWQWCISHLQALSHLHPYLADRTILKGTVCPKMIFHLFSPHHFVYVGSGCIF